MGAAADHVVPAISMRITRANTAPRLLTTSCNMLKLVRGPETQYSSSFLNIDLTFYH